MSSYVYRLEPSKECSNSIFDSFKSQVNPNGVKWKGVSEDIRDFYFGEFKKTYYWDSSITQAVLSPLGSISRDLWQVKRGVRKQIRLTRQRFPGDHQKTLRLECLNVNVWWICEC